MYYISGKSLRVIETLLLVVQLVKNSHSYTSGKSLRVIETPH